MEKRLLLTSPLLNIVIRRLCEELIENHENFDNTVLIGLQPKGIFLAEQIKQELESILDQNIKLGYLDTTFHRDDFRRRDSPLKPNMTKIDFVIENKEVILIDDVLYTGRSVRSALDAMNAFGRPKLVELLVLIDRIYARDLPIQAHYIGKKVNTIDSQRVKVEWKGLQAEEDSVWLIESVS